VNQQVTALASDFRPAGNSLVTTSSYRRPRHVRLAALPSAAPWARRILRHMLREWQLESMSDPALLLVSELVTNAVKASASQPGKDQSLPMIGLTLQFTDAGLRAEVWDANPAFPVLQQAELMEPGGLELVLVDALADAWGHRAADGGKVVWFTIAPHSVT